MTHCIFAHKFIPMPQAMTISDAKAAVDKEWKKASDDSSVAVGESQKARRRSFKRHRITKIKSSLVH